MDSITILPIYTYRYGLSVVTSLCIQFHGYMFRDLEPDELRVPELYEKVDVCKYHKCFISPMHRLNDTRLFSVCTCLCNSSLFLPSFFCFFCGDCLFLLNFHSFVTLSKEGLSLIHI